MSTRDVRSLHAPAAASTLLVGRSATPSNPRRFISRRARWGTKRPP